MLSDIPRIMEIVAEARASLHRHGVDQWQGDYPNAESFSRDIERGECFLLCHGAETAGFFALSTAEEPCYADITDGKWTADMPYCVLHRCAVAAKYRGSGISAFLLEGVEEQAGKFGLRCIRTDTHRKNKSMQKLLRENGFRYRGNVLVDEKQHDPRRQAFEKILKDKKQR